MVRVCALALAAIALVGVAWAQTTQTYSLGSREAGAAHNSRLTARNENCTQPLDIRFDFAPSPWLRPQGDNVVRGIPAGESRALPVVIDLTQAQPGTLTAQVDVVCENCRGLIFLNCRFDRQRLLLTVEATAPAPAPLPAPPTTTAPAPQPRPQPASTAPPPRAPAPAATPPSTPAPVQQDAAPAAAPAPAPADGTAASAPVACDCGSAVTMWQAAAAAGGALALIGLGWGAMSSAGANAARKALEEASRAGEAERTASNDLALKALEKKLEGAEADAERAADNVAALAQAQAQAMRVLNALGQAGDNAAEADAWTAIAAGAGHFVNEAAGRVVPDRGEGRLSRALEAARGKHGDAAAVFEGDERARMDWLIARGFAFSDADASAVLSEMANWRTHTAMGDMIARLQKAIEARGRAEAEVRALEAQIFALEHG